MPGVNTRHYFIETQKRAERRFRPHAYPEALIHPRDWPHNNIQQSKTNYN